MQKQNWVLFQLSTIILTIYRRLELYWNAISLIYTPLLFSIYNSDTAFSQALLFITMTAITLFFIAMVKSPNKSSLLWPCLCMGMAFMFVKSVCVHLFDLIKYTRTIGSSFFFFHRRKMEHMRWFAKTSHFLVLVNIGSWSSNYR